MLRGVVSQARWMRTRRQGPHRGRESRAPARAVIEISTSPDGPFDPNGGDQFSWWPELSVEMMRLTDERLSSSAAVLAFPAAEGVSDHAKPDYVVVGNPGDCRNAGSWTGA
jgi:hypothetical protein